MLQSHRVHLSPAALMTVIFVGCATDGRESLSEDTELTEGTDAVRPLIGETKQAISANARWTSWISEEFTPALCPPGQATIAAECNGSFCDQVRLRCDNFTTNMGEPRWTGWVETGGDIFGGNTQTDAVCQPGEWMTGIGCNGDYCDNVQIQCTPTSRVESDCRWTDRSYSEEDGVYSAPLNYFLRGVRCRGTHCDNKWYYVCRARPERPDSCGGRCGSSSENGACWCDQLCDGYGDCCADFRNYCM